MCYWKNSKIKASKLLTYQTLILLKTILAHKRNGVSDCKNMFYYNYYAILEGFKKMIQILLLWFLLKDWLLFSLYM